MARTLFLSIAVILGVVLPGCVAVGAEEGLPIVNPQAQSIQIILKFKDPLFNPTVGDYLRKVSTELGTNITYVRPMSGDAHVLRINVMRNGEVLQSLLDRLAARPEVEWVEQDRIMRRQSR